VQWAAAAADDDHSPARGPVLSKRLPDDRRREVKCQRVVAAGGDVQKRRDAATEPGAILSKRVLQALE